MKNENLFTLDLNNQKLPDIKDYFNNTTLVDVAPQITEVKEIKEVKKTDKEQDIEDFEQFKERIFNNFELFFRNYLKLFFKVTEGCKLKENWHLDLVGYNVRKILMKKSYRDVWNLCPTSGKTSISIAFATLYVGFYPNTRAVVFSGTQAVRDKYARCIRMMLESVVGLTKEEDGIEFPSYQDLFPNVRISDERNRQEEFYIKNFAGSFRILSIDSKTTGLDVDLLIVDDPIDYRTMKEQGFKYVENVNDIVSYLGTRLREIDCKKPELIIMQRMCEGDSTEHLLQTQCTENWNHVVIPAKELRQEYSYHNLKGMCYEYYDKKIIFREHNSIYMDDKDETWLLAQKNKLNGSNIDFEYQFFQSSKGIQESIINIGKIRKYETIDYSKSYTKLLSIDPATGTDSKDRNAIGLWLMDEDINLYLYKLYFNHYQYQELLNFLSMLEEQEMIDIMLIEHTSVGISLVQDLEKKRYGRSLTDKERRERAENPRNHINAIKVPTNKEMRAYEANTFIELGKLYLPDRLINYTELKGESNLNVLDLLLSELKNFPMTKHDDGVDMCCHTINYVKSRFAMKKQKSFKNKIYTI
jgi:phage terminase large subunit-like protein